MSDSARSLLTRASGFWSFNIAATAVFQMDFIVLSQYAPAEQIVVYTIAAKIFAVMAFVTGAVLQAFWPECAEAVMHGNWRLIDKFTLRYLTWSILGVALFTLLFLIFNEYIVSMFSKNDTVSIPSSFIVAMGLMYVIRVWTDVYAVILQSMNDIKILLWWAVLQAFLGLGLQILLVPNYGIYGTVIALCLSWLLTVSWLAPKRVLHHKNSSGRIVT
jgi:O-antigen/teichoic acid export membrane protein